MKGLESLGAKAPTILKTEKPKNEASEMKSVHIPADVHKQAKAAAAVEGVYLHEWLSNVIRAAL